MICQAQVQSPFEYGPGALVPATLLPKGLFFVTLFTYCWHATCVSMYIYVPAHNTQYADAQNCVHPLAADTRNIFEYMYVSFCVISYTDMCNCLCSSWQTSWNSKIWQRRRSEGEYLHNFNWGFSHVWPHRRWSLASPLWTYEKKYPHHFMGYIYNMYVYIYIIQYINTKTFSILYRVTEKRLTRDLLRISTCSNEVPMGHDGHESWPNWSFRVAFFYLA